MKLSKTLKNLCFILNVGNYKNSVHWNSSNINERYHSIVV